MGHVVHDVSYDVNRDHKHKKVTVNTAASTAPRLKMEDIDLPLTWSKFEGTNQPYPAVMSMNVLYFLQKYCRWSKMTSAPTDRRYCFMHTLADTIFDNIDDTLADLHDKLTSSSSSSSSPCQSPREYLSPVRTPRSPLCKISRTFSWSKMQVNPQMQ